MEKYKIKLFDVTLRDGLQDIPEVYDIEYKKKLLDSIMKDDEEIDDYEIGSYPSLQRVPQMKDSTLLYEYALQKYPNKNFYMLIFNRYGLNEVVSRKKSLICLSLITSYCPIFLQQNMDKTPYQTFQFIRSIFQNKDIEFKGKKVYISTFCGSPYTPYQYHELSDIIQLCIECNVNHITLSDTYGLLTPVLFQRIIDDLRKDFSSYFYRFSLHLHKNIHYKTIIEMALQNNIYTFDISHIRGGGCVILKKEEETLQNLHFQDILPYLSS